MAISIQPWLVITAIACLFSLHAPLVSGAPPTSSGQPICSQGAICFSGEVWENKQFQYALSSELEFVLTPGWTIAIMPKHPEGDCKEFSSVVNPPYHAHRDLDINMSYGWKAEDEVSTSTRRFHFVTNCRDYRVEYKQLSTVLWGRTPQQSIDAQAKLGTSSLGAGRLWIVDSKIAHVKDTISNDSGSIRWMKFAVEITLPAR